MKFKLILFCLSSICHISAQIVTSYDLDVNIDAGSQTVYVNGVVDIDFERQDSVALILWKNTLIREITCNDEPLNYAFDTLSASPIMYIPNGSELTITKMPGSQQKQSIKFVYECDMSQLNSWANSFTEEWIELNIYCAWYPVEFESRNYKVKATVNIDPGYSITGSGIVNKSNSAWKMVQPWDSFDIVIIASQNLASKILNNDTKSIETIYHKNYFLETHADSIINECKFALDLFEKYFGRQDSSYLKFVISPFERGGGYSRKNFVCMRTKHFNYYTITKGIAHEIAHFWWNGAKTTTWEDWLNESFAEYSMLLYIREKWGNEAFEKQVEEYENKTKGLPPIWGIDRNSSQAYSVLYEYGSIMLYEMEKKIGSDVFLEFLKEVVKNNINTTEKFLKLVEVKLTKENRDWFENKLKGI